MVVKQIANNSYLAPNLFNFLFQMAVLAPLLCNLFRRKCFRASTICPSNTSGVVTRAVRRCTTTWPPSTCSSLAKRIETARFTCTFYIYDTSYIVAYCLCMHIYVHCMSNISCSLIIDLIAIFHMFVNIWTWTTCQEWYVSGHPADSTRGWKWNGNFLPLVGW